MVLPWISNVFSLAKVHFTDSGNMLGMPQGHEIQKMYMFPVSVKYTLALGYGHVSSILAGTMNNLVCHFSYVCI